MGLAGIAVGAAATIGSAVVGSNAAGSASQAQRDAANTAAQTQLQMYNQTRSDLLPYNTLGSNAFSQLANYFGFGGPSQPSYSQTIGAPAGYGGSASYGGFGGIGGFGDYSNLSPGSTGGLSLSGFNLPSNLVGGQRFGNPVNTTPLQGGGTQGVPNFGALTSALEQFPGYQFALSQGQQALDRSAAARGQVLSGAQLKDSQAYGQGLALNGVWQPFVSELNTAASLGENAAATTGNNGATAANGIAQSQLAAGQASAAGTIAQGNIFSSALNRFTSQLGNPIGSFGDVLSGTGG